VGTVFVPTRNEPQVFAQQFSTFLHAIVQRTIDPVSKPRGHRNHAHPTWLQGVVPPAKVGVVILIIEETRPAIMATLHDVQR
jgi:hypothetical protein